MVKKEDSVESKGDASEKTSVENNPTESESPSLSNNGKKEKENPFNNPPIGILKKTGESFLQDSDCFKVAPKLAKCRECKWSQHNKNAASSSASIFCRYVFIVIIVNQPRRATGADLHMLENLAVS